MESLWKQGVTLSEGQVLQGEIQVQNLIIGGGMTGILTAYFLKKSGQQAMVVEASSIASGQTQNTTAKITSQHGLIYEDMIRNNGFHRAKGYAEANEWAIGEYEEIINEEGIACDFERLPSFLYSTEIKGRDKLLREDAAAQKLGLPTRFLEGNVIKELPFEITGAVCFYKQAQFHPLKVIKKLSEGLEIYERTNVLSVKGHKVITDNAVIIAENIIFATHYPFPIVPGFYFLRQHQDRSYVLALEGKGVPKKLSGMYYGIDEGGLSFRSAEGKLLLGGGSHRTGKVKRQSKYEGFCYLRAMSERYYPEGAEVSCWAAQDCMPHDGIPFIGKYSIFRPYWYVATGFQKWGMTSAMIAARLISDSICGKENAYRSVFAPQRLLFRAGIRDLCVDVGESVIGLIKGFLGKKKRRCRHMGCHLEWNAEEQSWDCPCHGSRYDRKGQLKDNPAQRNISLF
ncbi:MAG: FAD-dependent oxidoreductase [Lachnospiraceae bacterium]|nr:FAD-dependent oxidoreductase [Lachnospiraceae bacterium]